MMRTETICWAVAFVVLGTLGARVTLEMQVLTSDQASQQDSQEGMPATRGQSSSHNATENPGCILTDQFRGEMYEKMWQFMNPQMMTVVLQNWASNLGLDLKMTSTPGVEDYDGEWPNWPMTDNMELPQSGVAQLAQKQLNRKGWPQDFWRSICFKGDADKGGHYVYVDAKADAHGSYEKGLLIREEDDGICHGAALGFWLSHEAQRSKYRLEPHPCQLPYVDEGNNALEAFKYNYRTILKIYIDIIEKGFWDNALWQNFYNDVTPRDNMNVFGQSVQGAWTTQETIDALKALKGYIHRFDPVQPFQKSKCAAPQDGCAAVQRKATRHSK